MPHSYQQLTLRSDIRERLDHLRRELSLQHCFNESTLGLSSVILLLLEHFQNALPSPEWLQATMTTMPKRGRPPLTGTKVVTDQWGKEVVVQRVPAKSRAKEVLAKGHEFVSPAARPGISVCKLCDEVLGLEFMPEGRGQTCPSKGGRGGPPYSKKQLLAIGFTEEEVTWTA